MMLIKEVLNKYIPSDHFKQVTLEYYLEKILKLQGINKSFTVLDLGCGKGESINYFTKLNNKIEWYGVDIEKSPEVLSRTGSSERFITFDGINIPFEDNYFDLIFSKQVFEHVKNPRELLAEVSRVLKPGGYFVGSTSHLEPFHSYSYWNYTPFGFSVLIEEVNLKLLHLRAGIDSFTLIFRKIVGSPKFFDIFWKTESPFNFILYLIGKLFRVSVPTMNAIKLQFCGQFIFFVTKDEAKRI